MGGLLVVFLLVVFLRVAYIVEEQLPFPEEIACAEVLRSGAHRSASATPLAAGYYLGRAQGGGGYFRRRPRHDHRFAMDRARGAGLVNQPLGGANRRRPKNRVPGLFGRSSRLVGRDSDCERPSFRVTIALRG
jgi:hypothetical protein